LEHPGVPGKVFDHPTRGQEDKQELEAGPFDKLAGTNLPIDPFSARPLKLLSKNGGIIIYSFGGNQRDNGGAEDKAVPFNSDDDETFCFGEAFKERRLTPPEDSDSQ
jgi:hypothetical protein